MWNLAKTARFKGIVRRTDKLRFVLGYLELRPGGRRHLRDFLAELDTVRVRVFERDVRRTRKRCHEMNRDFIRISNAELKGFVRKERDDPWIEKSEPEIVAVLKDASEASRGQVVREQIRIPIPDGAGRHDFEYRVYVQPDEEAELMWENANVLYRFGQFVLPPRAWIELEDKEQGLYVSEGRTDAVIASEWVRRRNGDQTEALYSFCEQTGRLVRGLHELGFRTPGLKSDDLILSEGGPVRLDTVPTLEIRPNMGREERRKDLVTLVRSFEPPLPLRASLRFLRAYLGEGQWTPENIRFYLDDSDGTA
jgi:hypothetical protein